MKGTIKRLTFKMPNANVARLDVNIPFDTSVSKVHAINLGKFGALEYLRHFDPINKTTNVALMDTPFRLGHEVVLAVDEVSTMVDNISIFLVRENLPEGWALTRVESTVKKTVYLDIKRQE